LFHGGSQVGARVGDVMAPDGRGTDQRPTATPRVPWAAHASFEARLWAWQIATANASAASARRISAPGSSRRTIISTWSLSAPPVPTTAFLTVLAPYSVTGTPARAGASSATPRA